MADGRYIIVQNVKDEIPDDILKWLTSDTPDGNPSTWTIDNAKIGNAIARAEATVDAQVSKRYVAPLDLTEITEDAASDKIKLAAILLTWYYLYDAIGLAEKTSAKAKFASAMDILKAIAEGRIELPGAETQARKRIYYTAPKPKFTRNIKSNTDRVSNL